MAKAFKKSRRAGTALEAAARMAPLLRGLFESPTFVAVGLDPKGGALHVCIRNGQHQHLFKEPLSGQAKAVFELVRGLLTPPKP